MVANLKPTRITGVTSQGMLLAGTNNNFGLSGEVLAATVDCTQLGTNAQIVLGNLEQTTAQLASIDTDESRTQLLGNTLLFMPWGFFLPLLWRRFRRILPVAGMCLLLTCFIEGTQLFIGRTGDVDDLILNLCGVILGYFCWGPRGKRK